MHAICKMHQNFMLHCKCSRAHIFHSRCSFGICCSALRAVAHLSLHLISIDNHKYISDEHGLAPDEMKSASDSFACSFRTCCSVFQRTVCAHLHLHSSIRSYFEPAYTTLHTRTHAKYAHNHRHQHRKQYQSNSSSCFIFTHIYQ